MVTSSSAFLRSVSRLGRALAARPSTLLAVLGLVAAAAGYATRVDAGGLGLVQCKDSSTFKVPANGSSTFAERFSQWCSTTFLPPGATANLKFKLSVTDLGNSNKCTELRIDFVDGAGGPGISRTFQLQHALSLWPGWNTLSIDFGSLTVPNWNGYTLTGVFSSSTSCKILYSQEGDNELRRFDGSDGSWRYEDDGIVFQDVTWTTHQPDSCVAKLPVFTGTIQGSNGATFSSDAIAVYRDKPMVAPPFFYNLREGGGTLNGTVLGTDAYKLTSLDGTSMSGQPITGVGALVLGCPASGGWGGSTAAAPSPQGIFVQNLISAHLADGRQFGQLMPSFSRSEATPSGGSAFFPTTHDGSRFRVNAGVMATEDGTVVTWTPIGPIGTTLAAGQEIHLDRGGSTQLNDVASLFGLGNRSNFMLQMSVASGAALGYVSVLDGKGAYTGTSDPTTVLPVTPASQVTLLEVGAVSGINQFSGSAMIANHSDREAQVRADFYARGSIGVTSSQTFSLGAGEVRGYEDVVSELVGQSNVVGTLVLTATNGALISAIGREFAVFKDGQGAVTGTAGQLMPGLTDEDLLVAGQSYEMIGALERQTASGPERSHLGAFNPGASDVTLTVAMFSADNVAEGSITRTVRPGELLRVNNVVSAIDSAQDGGVKRLHITVSGPLQVLGYRVNATGDPVTLRAFRWQ